MKKLLPIVMLLMTAGAANAGGLVTKHASSVQLTVDAARTTATRMGNSYSCLLYTSPSPRDGLLSRMPSSA